MSINYNHSQNLHTVSGPQAALPIIFADEKPKSLLDVGCGNGTWLRAALDFGIPHVFGVDGVEVPNDQLYISIKQIQLQDLTVAWNLNKRFEVVICLEVAEHLDAAFAPTLVEALTRHGDTVYFSAACPGQRGQHHVNCQWPTYWQKLFNDRGFVCSDSVRWRIWDESRIELWYRQNMFVARLDIANAGREPRIKAVVHPEMVILLSPENEIYKSMRERIEEGHMTIPWYFRMPVSALGAKLKRHLP